MKVLLAPAVALMRRLRYPYKFAVIGVLALSEILFLFLPLASNLQEAIDVAQQELYGLAVDKPMLTLVQVVQQHRGLSAAFLGGVQSLHTKRKSKEDDIQSAVAAVSLAVAQHGARLNITTRWNQAQAHWQTLRASGLTMRVDANRAAHTALISELLQIVETVGETSFLILDPEASSYHLMDAATINLPRTLELLGQLRAHGAGVLATKTLDDAGRLDLAGEAAVLRVKRSELDSALKKITTSSPLAADRVYNFASQFRKATDGILLTVNDDILPAKFSTSPERYVDTATAAIDLGFEQAQTVLLPLLEQLLQERIQRLQAEYTRGAALTIASMLLFGYLAAGAYFVVIASVQTLQAGADRMATGDLTTPIILLAKDELQLVATSFNHMGEQLALRTDQLHQTGATLSQVQEAYDKEHALAVLAVMVPSIAHDLNTPIGNSNLAASSMRETLARFRSKLEHEGLRKSDLNDFLNASQEGIDIIERAGSRAAALAANLKHFSIDLASERRRVFSLGQLLDEVLTTLKPSLLATRWHIERYVEPELTLDSYPGPLGQILINLIQNAAVHAFEGRSNGVLMIVGSGVSNDMVSMVIRDNGRGMAPDVLAHAFEPFFTTKVNHGGSGVGLAYAQRLATATLGGSLEVASELGLGTTFTLRIPRTAPADAQPIAS